MLNIGVPEMVLILVVALIVFGPNRLPEIARTMGKFIRNFQAETNRAIDDLKRGIEPTTTGVFDEPDPGAADDGFQPIVQGPTPAEPAEAARPAARRRSNAPRTRSAAPKKKPATPRKKAAPKKTAAARRSPRNS